MAPRSLDFNLTTLLIVIIVLGSFLGTYNIISIQLYSNHRGAARLSTFPYPVEVIPEAFRGGEKVSRKFHVALSATADVYSQWQSRVAYFSYKKVKDMPRSDMGEFTRILHSGVGDHLMDEIPTFVVDKLPEGADKGFVPLNRGWAFIQWLDLATFDEEYVMMIEPDHIFVKPIPNLAFGDIPVGFKFFYMAPAEEAAILRKFYPLEKGPITNIDPIGNSPVIIKKHLLKKIASTWLTVSLRMKDDEATDKRFGWILEMYGYAVASALHGVRHLLVKDFMVQPPHDTKIGNSFLIHYTYGMDYTLKGVHTPGKYGEWRFDKRNYTVHPPPKNLAMPPKGVPETVVTILKIVNEASATLPDWDRVE